MESIEVYPPLISAKNAAIRFLLKTRSEDGMWRDFDTVAGAADEWITGYTANWLAEFGDEEGNIVASYALTELLRKQTTRGGGVIINSSLRMRIQQFGF